MQQVLLPLRLNCPWRAGAAPPVVRSAILGLTATIGAVRLVAPSHADSCSTVLMPFYSTSFARVDTLCVALRISPERSRRPSALSVVEGRHCNYAIPVFQRMA